MAELVAVVLLSAIVVVVYLLPTIVAVNMRHQQIPAIAALNVLLGWTFVGWVAALVWSLLAPPERRDTTSPPVRHSIPMADFSFREDPAPTVFVPHGRRLPPQSGRN